MSGKKKQIHPTNSFANMVSQAQLNALKPYIQQEVSNSAYGLYRALLKAMTDSQAAVQTRLMALERILTQAGMLQEEQIAMTVATIEDEILGYHAVNEPAQHGDRVRVHVKSRAKETDEWVTDKLVINALNVTGKDGKVQTLPELETALLGATNGQTINVHVLPETEEEKAADTKAELEVTVARVSRKTQKVQRETT